MHYYEVAPNQIVRSTSAFFTYMSPQPLPVGQIVTVEVGKKNLLGVVLHEVTKPSYETKPISAIIEQEPLPAPLIDTVLWMSDYYRTHLATVLQTVLPRGLQKKRRAQKTLHRSPIRNRTKVVFTSEQRSAIDTLSKMSPGSAILHGVTGSGKTTVYIEMARQTLDRGESVIVLVPEIALTSQLVDEFSHHFPDILLTHSNQTEAQRHLTWTRALTSSSPQVIIGPRSALFLPLKKTGLIIVDEAHEPTFKQEQSPRYSALRVASILARSHNAKVIFGSATPSVGEYYLAEKSNRPIIRMSKRARTDTVAPTVKLVDMTKRANFKHHRFLSDQLITTLTKTFESGHQALIFHNRRGSASTTLCENCGWTAGCPRCFIPFTLHADLHTLRCHICNTTDKVPTHCPACQSVDIIHKGIGTKLIESELRKIFPNKNIARFDGDSTSDTTVEQMYDALYQGMVDLIIGTQVIAMKTVRLLR